MTKRYLFVCGGAGKGLVDKREILGFDGLIQFDQQHELQKVLQDNRTLNFPIPVSGDVGLTSVQAIAKSIDDLTHERASKLDALALIKTANAAIISEYECLAAAHEQHLKDYGLLKEVIGRMGIPEQEYSDVQKKLAIIEGTVERKQKLKRELRSSHIPYLKLIDEIEALEKRILSFRFVLRELYPAQLAGGMTQEPIISSSYFNQPKVTVQMEQFFGSMTSQDPPTAHESVEIYIVSSMCGATGQGITQHVATHAAKYFGRTVPNAHVSVRFLRFGAWSYHSVGSAQNFRTNTNAAMAILHDAGFAYTHRVGLNELDYSDDTIGTDSDYVRADYQFYYLETPDVGRNETLRMQDIEIACRALIQEELSIKFQIIMAGISRTNWFSSALVRVGHWANEINSPKKYRETLEQLRTKILRLVAPNQRLIACKLRYELYANDAVATWELLDLVELKAPHKLRGYLAKFNGRSIDELSVADYLKSQEYMTRWTMMTYFLDAYFGLHDKHDFGYDFHIGSDDPQTPLERVAFDQQIAPKHSVQYIQTVMRANEVRAMALRLLASGEGEEGAIHCLFTQWDSMVPGFLDANTSIDRTVRDNIKSFATTYFKVRTLITLANKAEMLGSDFRDWSAVMVDYINRQHELMPTHMEAELTSCAELTDLRDGNTWLASINNTLVGDLVSAQVVNNFKMAVLWGSRGLTKAGLYRALGVPQQSSSFQVVEKLNTRPATFVHGSRQEKALWWQDQEFALGKPGQNDFSYRVFPPLPPEEYTELSQANDAYAMQHGPAPMYHLSHNAFFGQRILSVECVRPHGSLVETLLAPLLNSIQFRDSDRTVEGYIRRLAAASIGEPIYLTDELNEQITGGRVDLRRYFNTVGGRFGHN